MRRPFIAANWKMNKTIPETREFLKELVSLVKDAKDVDIIVAPPFTALSAAAESVAGANIKIAAQDIFYEEKGAFTGEISPAMILDSGCTHVIIGHSERRQYFNETDEVINKKVKAAKKSGLGVIFCIGESLAERESGKTFDVLKREVEKGLENVGGDNVVVAYEPVWAIGTGRTAAPSQAQEAHAYIRERLRFLYGNKADENRIIYGGSVTPENVDSLMACEDVDGALVGGASLKVESFVRLVKFNTEAR
ncbi:MAG: triose-phosphate isomerase [Nitrospiraceae bacterium]|nr:MAG: triose-phosphate isomerase [Nitrospiraceae bacterium]